MKIRFKTLLNKSLYWAGAAMGVYALLFESLSTLSLRPFSMSRPGRWFFVKLGRTGIPLRQSVLALLLVSQYWLIQVGTTFDTNIILLSPFAMFLCVHRRRVFSVTNNGLGKWSLHLNILSKDEREQMTSKWTGVNSELNAVVALAIEGGARTLACQSALLVQEETVQLFKHKLTRVFRQHGVQVRIEVLETKPLSTFLTGVHHPLRWFQKGLKAERLSHSTDKLVSRRIVVHIPTEIWFSPFMKAGF